MSTPDFTIFWQPGQIQIWKSSILGPKERFSWPEDVNAFTTWLAQKTSQKIQLFVEAPYDTWQIDLPLSLMRLQDWLRLLYRRRKKLRDTHLLWRMEGYAYKPSMTHIWGFENHADFCHLLEVLTHHKKRLVFYSTHLTRIAAAEKRGRAQGLRFQPLTLNLVIHLTPTHLRHFVFWGRTLIFTRDLSPPERTHTSAPHDAFLEASAETMAYVSKQNALFTGAFSHAFWDTRHQKEETFLLDFPSSLRKPLHLNHTLLCQNSSFFRQKRWTRWMKMGCLFECLLLIWSGGRLYHVKEIAVKRQQHLKILTEQLEIYACKRQVFPFSPARVKAFLRKQEGVTPPPLALFKKIESCLPSDFFLSGLSWDQRAQDVCKLTLDVPKILMSMDDPHTQELLSLFLERLQKAFEDAVIHLDKQASRLHVRVTLTYPTPIVPCHPFPRS